MRLPPPLLAIGAAVAQRVLTPHKNKATPLRRTASAATAACSIALMASATRALREHGTTLNPFDPASSSYLVTTGPFAITRNPMYTGLSGLLAANAIRRGSLLAVVPLAAFMAKLDRSQIPQEEAALSATFGADYDAYRARSPRWLRVPVSGGTSEAG